MNGHTRYKKVANKYSELQGGGGGGGGRGFRLTKYRKLRFSVERLRARFVYFFRFLSRWSRGIKNSSSKMTLIGMRREGRSSSSSNCSPTTTSNRHNQRLRSFGRSNSFYTEAIADCLEFIKTRSSSNISVDQHQVCPR